MKLGFNEATSMGCSDLQTDLLLCEKNGYDFIEIRLDKLREYLQTHTIEDLCAFFEKSHLKPCAFNALEGINFRTPEEWETLMTGLDLFCQVGKRVGCNRVIVVPTADVGGKTVSQIREDSLEALRRIDARARVNGWPVVQALEFVGYPNLCINTFAQAYEIVELSDVEGVSIVLDCFHFHAMGSRLADLEKLDPAKLAIVHVDDSEDLPVGAARDEQRLWPGEGAVDLNGIFGILKEKGYDGIASVELFRPEYYALAPEENIRIAKEKMVAALKPHWAV